MPSNSLPRKRPSSLALNLAFLWMAGAPWLGGHSWARAALSSASEFAGTHPPSWRKVPVLPFHFSAAGAGGGGAVFSPLGIGIAILFAVLMITLFSWMFSVPPASPLPVIKARHSVSALHRILVPVSADLSSEGAAELACRLGASQKAEIMLVYVVEVPFTLSLNTPLREEYAKGEEALRTAEFIIKQHGLPVHLRSLPARYAWGGILNLARQEAVDAIVMSAGHGDPRTPDGLGRTARELLKRAQCEVILAKMPVHSGHQNGEAPSGPTATQERA